MQLPNGARKRPGQLRVSSKSNVFAAVALRIGSTRYLRSTLAQFSRNGPLNQQSLDSARGVVAALRFGARYCKRTVKTR